MTDNITTTENSGQTSFNMDKYRFKETPKGVRILIDVLKYAVLVIACLIVIVPLVVVLLGSLKSHEDFLTSGAFELPKVVELANFKTAFLQGNVMRGLINTAIILVFSCAGTIITGTMTAFVVQRFTMVFTKLVKNIFWIIVITIIINSRTIAIADASPIFWYWKPVSIVLITKVDVPILPPVIIYGISNTEAAPFMARISCNAMIVLIPGKIMCQNFCHAFAPSRSAAS